MTKPRDLRELLGGYAAGTLRAEEREALFQAALENQSLFDALAGEEALRELLADPACRAQLLRDLDQQPAAFWQRFAQWMRKPATLAFAGSAAALVLVIGVVRFTQREPEAPKLVAQAPRQVELPPPASPIGQPEPKLMRPTAPPARTQAERVRRELAAPATAAAPQPAALSCAVLARSSQGDWIEATPDATFREGAEVRLRVRSAEDGFIVVTAQDGATVTMLTPATGAPVGSGQDLILPPTGSFELAGASGEKNLRISFLPRSPAAPAPAFQFAKSAAAPAARRKGETADSAQAPAAGTSAEATKRKAEIAESREEAAKPPQVIELRLVYRSK